jgi:Ca-activated chloride channel family protein
MRLAFITLILVSLCGGAFAQSGRAKPTPTPTPKRIEGPSVLFPPPGDRSSNPKKTDPSPSPTSDDDVIKIQSALVPIPVSVLDERGRTIGNLKLADFTLMVDGKPAEIGDLARSETPIRLAMLFDNSSSVIIARDFEKEAAVRFFKRVVRPDRDLAALYSVADTARRESPFTKDVDLLTRAIENFPPPEGATALLDAIIEGADYLKSVDGRRVMVIVSDGEDTYSDLRTTLEGVVKALQFANVQVFVVNTKEFENYKRTGMRAGNANIRTLTAERRMQEITQQTGGEVYSPITDDELRAAFDQISAELTQQYILSYYPEDDAKDKGAFREIALAVKGKPGYQVRTRKGYYVPRK